MDGQGSKKCDLAVGVPTLIEDCFQLKQFSDWFSEVYVNCTHFLQNCLNG